MSESDNDTSVLAEKTLEPVEVERKADKPRPKIHKYHKRGDVVLKANEGTYFYADSWRLIEASTFFAGLFTLPGPQSISKVPTNTSHISQKIVKIVTDELLVETRKRKRIEQGEASEDQEGDGQQEREVDQEMDEDDTPKELMEIDTTSKILDILLNLTNISTPFTPMTTFTDSAELLRVCDMYTFRDDIVIKVRDRLYYLAKTRQWELLELASKRDDISMGRVALNLMSSDDFSRTLPELEGVSPENQPLKTKAFWTRMRLLQYHWQANILYNAFMGGPTNPAKVPHTDSPEPNSGRFMPNQPVDNCPDRWSMSMTQLPLWQSNCLRF